MAFDKKYAHKLSVDPSSDELFTIIFAVWLQHKAYDAFSWMIASYERLINSTNPSPIVVCKIKTSTSSEDAKRRSFIKNYMFQDFHFQRCLQRYTAFLCKEGFLWLWQRRNCSCLWICIEIEKYMFGFYEHFHFKLQSRWF